MINDDAVVSLLLLAIPLLAIAGGMALGILRVLGQQRLAELARKERIAAIERGLDPDKLPPLMSPDGYDEYGLGNGRLRRAHGLMIGGAILLAVGLSLFVLLRSVEPDKSHWMLGLLPFLVGGALLGCSAVIWPRKR
jgi:hypothetical protein